MSRAEEYLREAESKYSGSSSFFSFFKGGKTQLMEEAAELFVRAGNSFKARSDYLNSAKAFWRAYQVYNELGIEFNTYAAEQALNAGNMYSKVEGHAKQASECVSQAAIIYREDGNPTFAAKALKQNSENFKNDGAIDSAIDALLEAAKIYEDENSAISASTHYSEAAILLSDQKRYSDAARYFEKAAELRCKDRLTQMSAFEFFTKAVIMHMCNDDAVNASRRIDHFVSMAPSWEQTREYTLVKTLVELILNPKPTFETDFSNACAEYDHIRRLEKWYVDNLYAIKMSNSAVLGGGGSVDGGDQIPDLT